MRAEGEACSRRALRHPAAVAGHYRHADEERGGAQVVERRRRATARARGAKTGRWGCSEECIVLDDVVAVLTRLHGAEVEVVNAVLQRNRKAEFPGAGCYEAGRRAGNGAYSNCCAISFIAESNAAALFPRSLVLLFLSSVTCSFGGELDTTDTPPCTRALQRGVTTQASSST
jgi:hypothetical protein